MTGAETSAARRYARALLDVAGPGGDASLRADLEGLAAVFAAQPELRRVLLHPAVPAERKRAVVAALWPGSRPSDLLLRLVDLLLARARVELLPLIAAAYTRLSNAQRGVVEAEAVSAQELGETETREVASAVGRATGKKVELHRRVDPSLIGGLLLRMQGRVYDGSVRARLRALRARLVGAEGS